MLLARRAGAAIALAFLSASAQADTAAVERCRQAADLEARVACLEAALAGGNAEPTMDARPAVPAEPAAPEAPRTVNVPEATAEAVADNPARQSVAAPAAANIGAEQLRRNRSAAEIEADLARAANLEVERYDEVPYQRLVIYLRNGQVWRQIEGDTQHVRATLRKNRTVDIEETSLGGYQLRLNEMRRTIRVQRVR